MLIFGSLLPQLLLLVALLAGTGSRVPSAVPLGLVAAGHAACGARTWAMAEADDGLTLILELLCQHACPSSVALLLRMSAVGALVPAAAAAVIASGSAAPMPRVGLAAHAAAGLCAGRVGARGGALGTQPPLALHGISLALLARDLRRSKPASIAERVHSSS